MGFHHPVHTSLEIVTAPASEPITISDVKCHARVDTEDEDLLISQMIKAARISLERIMNRTFVNTTFDYFLDHFPAVILLPRAPLNSVTSITYLDSNGDSQTLASTEYSTDLKSEPGRIIPAPTKSWPTTEANQLNTVTVRL